MKKKSLTPWRPALLLALVATLSAGAAFADKDDAPGQQRKREAQSSSQSPSGAKSTAPSSGSQLSISIGAVFGAQDRATVQAYYGDRYAQSQRCPPGLAKKNNGCLPPGQAKKYAVGQPLPAEVTWYPVPPVLVQRLPALPTHHAYVRVGTDVLILNRSTRLVVDVAAAFPL